MIARPFGGPYHAAQQPSVQIAHIRADHAGGRCVVAGLEPHVAESKPRPQRRQFSLERLEGGDDRVERRNRTLGRVAHDGRCADHIDIAVHLSEGGFQPDRRIRVGAPISLGRLGAQLVDHRPGGACEWIVVASVGRATVAAEAEQAALSVVAQGRDVAVLGGVHLAQETVVPTRITGVHATDRFIPDRARDQGLAHRLLGPVQMHLDQRLFLLGLVGVDAVADDGQDAGHADHR